MQTLKKYDSNLAEQWRSYPSIQRWCQGLLHVTGLTRDEVANRLDTLFQFCLLQDFDPETVAQECREGQDKLARRTFYLQRAQQTPANLIVQSFLVHNGVNVFGDLICMPSTRKQIIAEQGHQWFNHGSVVPTRAFR